VAFGVETGQSSFTGTWPIMCVQMDLMLPALLGLLALLAMFAALRGAGRKTWLLTGLLVATCVGSNPGKGGHLRAIRGQAQTETHGALARFVGDGFAQRVDYRDFLLASVTVVEGRVISVGVLGEVLVTELRHVSERGR
jgi:hypothetical protein